MYECVKHNIPYVLVGGRLETEGRGAKFSLSWDGKSWMEGGPDLDSFFPPGGPARYEYRLRCELGALSMTETLGYGRFGAHGGDWGSTVTEQLALLTPPALLGIHTNMPATVPDDIAGALVCLAGVAVIMYAPRR